MSRPAKKAGTPGPFYMGQVVLYCHTCGRVVSSKRPTPMDQRHMRSPMYCSARCKSNKPGQQGSDIESTFVAAMELDASLAQPDEDDFQTRLRDLIQRKKQAGTKKGDKRITVACSDIQAVHFPESIPRQGDEGESEEDAIFQEGGEQSSTSEKENGASSVENTTDLEVRQAEGMKRARQKEMIKQAARRLIVFGYKARRSEDGSNEKRFCEALENGKVVEPSFAKGDWAIRWRG